MPPPPPPPPPPAFGPPNPPDPLASISPRTASILCYVPGIGWIAAIVVLASQRFRNMAPVRFHAFQGLYLFVAYLMNDQVLKWALDPFSHFHHLHDLVSAILVIMSIFMMVKASHDEMYSLPLFGDLAHRSMSEN
ncbi:MAG TPA: hypothetical protein VMB03_16985 [Bryobacteraceae bacterium]|nr:hypothetical protein [Bryobacteraceae bacterium]